MGEKEDREKAEKLAAAKKRVAQLQKKKKAAAGTGDKSTAKDKTSKDEAPQSPTKQTALESETAAADADEDADDQPSHAKDIPIAIGESNDADEALFNETIQAAQSASNTTPQDDDRVASDDELAPPPKSRHGGRQPSISVQSKLRSTSFRHSNGPRSPTNDTFSPEGDTMPDIYRKQTARIEELEKENKRLAKEAQDGEARWRKSEEDLEELRESKVEHNASPSAGPESGTEAARLRAEIDALKRQSRQPVSTSKGRRESGLGDEESDALRTELESKDSAISDMQLEISKLRSQVSAQAQGCETHGDQISALQQSLERVESRARSLDGELADTKKALSRASEKAVLEGTEKTSKDTKIKSLEREAEQLQGARDEAAKKAEGLEKKVEAMNKLHREAESRSASKLSASEAAARETQTLRAKIESLEKETGRLREQRKRTMSGGGADDGLDELEDEERKKFAKRIRDLESEVFDLRRGVWRDRRREMQPSGDTNAEEDTAVDGDQFDDVDLSGSGAASRRRSFANMLAAQHTPQPKHSGFSQVFSSGLAAFRAATTSPDSQDRLLQAQAQTRPRNDSLLQEFDDDDAAGFDEMAFAQDQREEEARQMVEHVREVKRGLKKWVGWRLDLVDARRGGGGGGVGDGEIFEV